MEQMVSAIIKELQESSHFFNEKTIHTIYLGGGTPSLLKEDLLLQLLKTINNCYSVDPNAEVTLEANPDDIQRSDVLESTHDAGFNRLSLGIQSFNDKALKRMNRAHNSEMTWTALELIHQSSYSNFSVDLIYSLPFLSIDEFREDLATTISIGAPHISTYALTIEERTVFGNWTKNGKLHELNEDAAATEYEMILKALSKEGYRNYEISNFGIPGFESRHNMSYWSYKPYLGIGPGAHSFDGVRRWSNIRNNALYIRGMAQGNPKREHFDLSFTERMNELILTSLRTDAGIPLDVLSQEHSVDLLRVHSKKVKEMELNGLLIVNKDNLCLSEKGKLLADQIAMNLFIEEQ